MTTEQLIEQEAEQLYPKEIGEFRTYIYERKAYKLGRLKTIEEIEDLKKQINGHEVLHDLAMKNYKEASQRIKELEEGLRKVLEKDGYQFVKDLLNQ